MQQVGPWELGERIGAGGMGTVWRARHAITRQEAALKLVDSAPESLLRLQREAQALTRLRHPNLVRVLDAGVHQGAPFLAMELVPGLSLSALVAASGPLAPERAAGIVARLAQGLAHAHAAGVVHRDVKPQNAVLRPDGQPVLIDFGLLRDAASRTLTEAGALLGTPGFAAPEQLGGERGAVGPWSDVWGLGATLHFLLTGRAPFPGEGLAAMLATLERTPEPPSRSRPEVPPGLDQVVLSCLAREPGARPGATELAAALEAPWQASRGELPRGALGLTLAAAALVTGALALTLSLGSEPRAAQPPAAASSTPSLARSVTDPPGPRLTEPAPALDPRRDRLQAELAADRAALLEGVARLPGDPRRVILGAVCAFGEQAQVLAATPDEHGVPVAIAAAARLDRGRVAVLAHSALLYPDWLARRPEPVAPEDSVRFLANVLRWLGRGGRRLALINEGGWPRGERRPDGWPPRAYLADPGSGAWLEEYGAEHGLQILHSSKVRAPELEQRDVVIWTGTTQLARSDEEALLAFVRAGGGLLVVITPYGTQASLPAGQRVEELSWGRVLAAAGLGACSRERLTNSRGVVRVEPLPPWLHGGQLLAALEQGLNPAELAPAEELAETLARLLGAARLAPELGERVRALAGRAERAETRALARAALEGAARREAEEGGRRPR